jgi:hypothetical protein
MPDDMSRHILPQSSLAHSRFHAPATESDVTLRKVRFTKPECVRAYTVFTIACNWPAGYSVPSGAAYSDLPVSKEMIGKGDNYVHLPTHDAKEQARTQHTYLIIASKPGPHS